MLHLYTSLSEIKSTTKFHQTTPEKRSQIGDSLIAYILRNGLSLYKNQFTSLFTYSNLNLPLYIEFLVLPLSRFVITAIPWFFPSTT